MWNEKDVVLAAQRRTIRDFIKYLTDLDCELVSKMLSKGHEYVKTAERTVVFTFGEVTFSRRVYRDKSGNYLYPIDETLGLIPYTRFSMELLFEIAKMATKMSYRKVASEIGDLRNIEITKDTVQKALKLVTNLYEEQKDYQFYRDDDLIQKTEVDTIYIEGDGVMVKTNDLIAPAEERTSRSDLAHFVVHRGVKKEYGKRLKLVDKHEFLAKSPKEARELVNDYIYNHYTITDKTTIITNSDMGMGYTPYVFNEMVAVYPRARHEHFWDTYHLNIRIRQIFKTLPYKLEERFFTAIKNHSKRDATLVLDTVESLIEDGNDLDNFIQFKNKFLLNFKYTKDASSRRMKHQGIGIMESQNSKIANRMKHQGMYWSAKGAVTMAKMIIDASTGALRELFFGEWREKYLPFKRAKKIKTRSYLLAKESTVSQITQVHSLKEIIRRF
ncbi:MAG: ISLre2 family transposase [Lactobacillaceae bacterium]|jgi:hypothetical protein|nr:ISLre2 family transposase [Lactobacillaceae bacterium]